MRSVELFSAYVAWLAREVPDAYANLAPGATDADLEVVAARIGRALPVEVSEVLRMHNGQRTTMTTLDETYAMPCLPTLSFLSTWHIVALWEEWEDLRRSQEQEGGLAGLQEIGSVFSAAEGVVRPLYTSPGWIPLWSDPVRADYVGLDFDPAERGTPGQIINFGRDEEKHFLCADGFTGLLEILLDEVVHRRAWRSSVIRTRTGPRPWFGDPDEHFFNALYARFSGRDQR